MATTITDRLGVSPGAPSYGNDLSAIEALSGTGILARIGSESWALRTLASGNAGIVVTYGDGISGNPTVTLAPVLAAIAALTPAADTILQYKSSAWAARTPAQVTADLSAMGGDGGSGGTKGLVPAPAAGDAAANKFLKASGVWAAITTSVVSVKAQVFTGSGTYTPSTGMLYCQIMCLGGGGGGGGVSSGGDREAGGGGAGGMSLGLQTAADIGASQTVTIGSAGSGATAGANTGGNGGDTSVGTLCIGKGGSGGVGSAGGSGGAGGAGGIAGTGNITASPGGSGLTGVGGTVGTSGSGANSAYGGGGLGTATNANGNAASGRGAGGGGGRDQGTSGNKSGGAGTAGLVIITEYCSQ